MLDALMGRAKKECIGLDISSSSVKLLELSRSKSGQYRVESYANEPLPPGAVSEKKIVDPNMVGEAIGKAADKAGVRTKQTALAMSGAAVITKIIQLPAGLSDHEMEEQIKAEADQYVPYKIEEVNIDFQVRGPVAGDDKMVDVLLAASRKEEIEQRCAAIEIAGLTPYVVDVETYALENACELLRHQMPDQGEQKTIAIVDVGGTNTSVAILHNLETVFTREQPFGGKQLVEDVMRKYGQSHDEAMRNIKQGQLPEDYESEVLAHFISDMIQQIDRNLQFFFSASSQYTNVDLILLAGGCAHIANIENAVSDKLKLPAAMVRPLANMSVASRARPQTLAKEEAGLLICCGLALRAFDPPRA